MKKEIIIKVKSGDKTAFKALFYETHPIVFRFVIFRVDDRDLAEDIVQEAFLRIWKTRNKLKPNKSVLALLMTISRRLILDHYKHQKVRRTHQENISNYLYNENEIQNDNTEILERKIRWIVENKLPQKCADVFILSRFEGLTNKETALFLGISTKTVENHITKANRIINKHFSN